MIDENIRLIEQLEYPLPILKVSAERIVTDAAAQGAAGSFFLENAGGGILTGFISSNNPCVTFDNERFEGNKVRVVYNIMPTGYLPGDNITTSALIMSNGGERIIPIEIKVVPPAIQTDEGTSISSLGDFLTYARMYDSQAQILFKSTRFASWLREYGFEHFDIYEYLRNDDNSKRAMDNFLLFCGLKQKSAIVCEQDVINVDILPGGVSAYEGAIRLHKRGWGFLDEPVKCANNCKWLSLSQERLNLTHFDETGAACVRYTINPANVEKRVAVAHITIGSLAALKLRVKKIEPISLKLSKNFYTFGESGELICQNNTGLDVRIDIETKDSFIRFDETIFTAAQCVRMPFALKSGALTSAQLALKKQPQITGSFIAHVSAGGVLILSKIINVTVGFSFL